MYSGNAEDIALAKLALKMFSTITIADRFAHAVKYSKCFIG
jgi:hypothetical protein